MTTCRKVYAFGACERRCDRAEGHDGPCSGDFKARQNPRTWRSRYGVTAPDEAAGRASAILRSYSRLRPYGHTFGEMNGSSVYYCARGAARMALFALGRQSTDPENLDMTRA